MTATIPALAPCAICGIAFSVPPKRLATAKYCSTKCGGRAGGRETAKRAAEKKAGGK